MGGARDEHGSLLEAFALSSWNGLWRDHQARRLFLLHKQQQATRKRKNIMELTANGKEMDLNPGLSALIFMSVLKVVH